MGGKDADAPLLSCSTLAYSLTSPAEKSAFMFLSKSQVVLPWATLTEPRAKTALSSVPAQTSTGESVAGVLYPAHAS